MANREPIPVTEIVTALEREAANTDTDPRWMAAQCLRHIEGWESRTLMCAIDARPSTYSSVETAVEQPKCNGLCRGHNTELSTVGWLPDVNCPVHGLKATLR